jgi:5-methylcytosine-specific restriction endonuclease McrA
MASAQQTRAWLRALTREVAVRLRDATRQHDLIRIASDDEISVDSTNTGGWATTVGYVEGDRKGGMEIWFDYWTRVEERKLCVCYYSSRRAFVMDMAAAVEADLGPVARFGNLAAGPNPATGLFQLVRPLSPDMFEKPIAEIYGVGGSEAYLCWYARRTPQVSIPASARLVAQCTEFLNVVSRSAAATLQPTSADLEYATAEDRRSVARHLRLERSEKLARIAKLRDGYTCQICGFSFAETYGRLGNGYAEAHHIAALSASPRATLRSARDLVTVCANCHRMLHRMSGVSDDVKALKRIVQDRINASASTE